MSVLASSAVSQHREPDLVNIRSRCHYDLWRQRAEGLCGQQYLAGNVQSCVALCAH